ncbi:hypothetical protein BIY26_21320 [Brenneria goodwinii]|uniref:Uncharacterized protein n=1 Tax=Brenneria goodwinii TaxID=1109412 RepID=A0AAE8EKI8_9GAMM|nr:hypothetical protein AWC36_21625 [Brenneria goodwinii]RLM16923.1 hypothetical protein BIY28_22395 [Brenneria goodwinii]RLM17159.1 hypothetical protein BIY26_21320 [Brenneria goodwinii]
MMSAEGVMRIFILARYWVLFFIVFYFFIYIGVWLFDGVFNYGRTAMLSFVFSSFFALFMAKLRSSPKK